MGQKIPPYFRETELHLQTKNWQKPKLRLHFENVDFGG